MTAAPTINSVAATPAAPHSNFIGIEALEPSLLLMAIPFVVLCYRAVSLGVVPLLRLHRLASKCAGKAPLQFRSSRSETDLPMPSIEMLFPWIAMTHVNRTPCTVDATCGGWDISQNSPRPWAGIEGRLDDKPPSDSPAGPFRETLRLGKCGAIQEFHLQLFDSAAEDAPTITGIEVVVGPDREALPAEMDSYGPPDVSYFGTLWPLAAKALPNAVSRSSTRGIHVTFPARKPRLRGISWQGLRLTRRESDCRARDQYRGCHAGCAAQYRHGNQNA